MTAYVTASLNQVVAEEYSVTAQLEPAVAATNSAATDLDVFVATTYSDVLTLDVFCDGSYYIEPTMRVLVAGTNDRVTELELSIAAEYLLTASLGVAVSDAVDIVLEPFDHEPYLTVSDLTRSIHPNAVTSPTIDFAAQGARPNDVLQIHDGRSAGHYLIERVELNVLFVHEAFLFPPGVEALSGELRRKREIATVNTAAVVMDQALFLAPNTLNLQLDVSVTA